MENWQTILVASYGLISFLFFCFGLYQSHWKKNSYGEIYPAIIIGAFVWGDAIVFGFFWFVISIITIYFSDWKLFLLIFSVFWTVRSHGEAMWSMNEESHPREIYLPEHFPLFKIFHNRSVFFVNQIFWQCICVISILASLYFGKLWLAKI